MKALNANVLVRFLTGDDEAQAGKVVAMLRTAESRQERFHVSLLVLLELVWVLESLYNCETTLTFDKKAAKESGLFRILA